MPDTLRWLKYQVVEEGHIRTYRVDLPPGTHTALVGVEAKARAENWTAAPGPEPELAEREELHAVAVPSEEMAVLAGGVQRAAQTGFAEAVRAPVAQEVEVEDGDLSSRSAVRDVCYYQGGHWYCWGRE